MPNSPIPEYCPSCQAPVNPGDTACWLCCRVLPVRPGPAPDAPRTGPDSGARDSRQSEIAIRPTFRFGSLMLIIALVAVCLGVMREAPGLGIPLILAAVPALLRTMLVASRQRGRGQPLDIFGKVFAFLSSFTLVAFTGLASLIAFVAVCLPIGMTGVGPRNTWVMPLALGGGIAAGLGVLYLMIRKLWPIRIRD